MSEERIVVVPDFLRPVRQLIVKDVYVHKILPALVRVGLYDEETERIRGKLRMNGVKILANTINNCAILSLSRARFEKPPEGYDYDQNLLASHMTEALGKCLVEVRGSDMHISFDGEGAFVRYIRTPLNASRLTKDEEGNAVSVQMGKDWNIRGMIDVTGEFNDM